MEATRKERRPSRGTIWRREGLPRPCSRAPGPRKVRRAESRRRHRSEEHTSELQSPCNLVCRLLLEKKKHTSELQSPCNLVCSLLLENKQNTVRSCLASLFVPGPLSLALFGLSLCFFFFFFFNDTATTEIYTLSLPTLFRSTGGLTQPRPWRSTPMAEGRHHPGSAWLGKIRHGMPAPSADYLARKRAVTESRSCAQRQRPGTPLSGAGPPDCGLSCGPTWC